MSAAPIPELLTLESLRQAATGCRACDLWRQATQVVFGEGSEDARMVLVGEQPGDHEDRDAAPSWAPPPSR